MDISDKLSVMYKTKIELADIFNTFDEFETLSSDLSNYSYMLSCIICEPDRYKI